MGKANAAPEIIYDPSSYPRKPRPGASGDGRTNFTSRDHKVYPNQQDPEKEELDIKKFLKDIQWLASSSMTWKERKKVENERVVALGGKPPKKHRVPLSVAIVPMKRQKLREQKRMEEDRALGRFSKRSNNHKVEKRKVEDRVLKASEGHFSKGVLNVKHLLQRKPAESDGGFHKMSNKGKKKGKGRGKGKGKGKGKKRRS